MLAIFAPITYPAFEVLNLIKYTRRKLQLNEFLTNEKDLGRLRIRFSSIDRRTIVWHIERPLRSGIF